MKIKNVSIFLPRNNFWYFELGEQIKDAFESFGLNVYSYLGVSDAITVYDLVKKNHSELIFDMNRPRSDLPFLSKDIVHVCWVVDFNGRPISDFCGSDITYLFGPKWLEKVQDNGNYKWMAPGVSIRHYFPVSFSYRYNASFVGHIPRPWSNSELERYVSNSGLRFGQVLNLWENVLFINRSELKVHEDYIGLLTQLVKNQFEASLVLDRVIEYDFTGRLVRLLNRQEMIDRLISFADLSIFGPESWGEWSQYRRYYNGFLQTSSEMRDVYRSSQINFHEGNNMHFRVLDCMASGGLIFARKNEYDDKLGGIKNFFKPGKHYVEFDFDDLEDKYRFYTGNQRIREKIQKNALDEVRKNHTWCHRVEQIIGDVCFL